MEVPKHATAPPWKTERWQIAWNMPGGKYYTSSIPSTKDDAVVHSYAAGYRWGEEAGNKEPVAI